MKELFMEIQEQFDGNIPDDFDYELFLAEKSKPIIVSEISDCCGYDMGTLVGPDGPSFSDLEICPNCKDRCISIKS